MLVDFIVREIVRLQHIYFLVICFVTFSIVSLSVQAVMVYLCTPLIEDAETFKLSILICRRVNTAVT